jgi:DNA topoisomerase-1
MLELGGTGVQKRGAVGARARRVNTKGAGPRGKRGRPARERSLCDREPTATAAGKRAATGKEVQRLSRRLQRALEQDRPPIVAGPKAPEEAAALAQLRYVSDEEDGIRRIKTGRAFRYVDAKGRGVQDPKTLARIKALAIPPAWTEVWICPDEDGHIQAVGRDDRKRKQYRYHARWRDVRDRTKFGRMIEFAQALPRIRKAVAGHLALPGLPRERVLATVVRLLEATSIRVGSDEYARANHHFGLTTLLDRHVSIDGGTVRFRFRGKSGVDHKVGLDDPRLARLVRQCQEIPGQRLFQYVDAAGASHAIGSSDVNAYLREVSGGDFTAKDFRTWAGTVYVAAALLACEPPETAKRAKAEVLAAIDGAALRLGNTRAVCRASYVHPAVIEAFLQGSMRQPGRPGGPVPRGLEPIEAATFRLLLAASRPASQARRAA